MVCTCVYVHTRIHVTLYALWECPTLGSGGALVRQDVCVHAGEN